MKIEIFTEADIAEAAKLAYDVWGDEFGRLGHEYGLLMCEYIVRYGWLNEEFAFKIVEEGRMLGCILAGRVTDKSSCNEWLERHIPAMNREQLDEALAVRTYFDRTGPKLYARMNEETDLCLSFFISSKPGYGKVLINEIMRLAKSKGYGHLYLWTDSSCNHEYYARNGYTLVSEFKSEEWAMNDDRYLTYIYKKSVD
ncbi:hypothetical protein [Alistipes sp.]|uniref:hypothetical protein n=1 Tax=Alistipes sp. TaxID=1872444 RepID=UPI0025C0BA4F|nr:hypothetical protein [Alistipes sp.]